jgi:hypothetical protein
VLEGVELHGGEARVAVDAQVEVELARQRRVVDEA